MNTAVERELLSIVHQLSQREAQMVLAYARTLKVTPLSEVGRAYLEMLAGEGASPDEIVQAAQAVQRVETDFTAVEEKHPDFKQRTDEHLRAWLRERGIDYDAVTEAQMNEIVDKVVQKSRHS